ncbi:MAG: hypothetical protein COZ85_02575 [Candidatus Moranbacteria bacterium CG_4_8_14_3_um_filter_34_16]|nr:MAG: hypothetical protein COT31_01095 [Candidatus Moranbacteria bacterium CG08_land_8_20_14_0_20_34_16]PIW94923.1 MAG: hypothetical protein COZ85_02575 [Candidatus Moranbacteria bacterium CG_4_8_14_3_um_filter_34_16]
MNKQKIILFIAIISSLLVVFLSFSLLNNKKNQLKENIEKKVSTFSTKEDVKKASAEINEKVASLEKKLEDLKKETLAPASAPSSSETATTKPATSESTATVADSSSNSIEEKSAEEEPQTITIQLEESQLESLEKYLEKMEDNRDEMLDEIDEIENDIESLSTETEIYLGQLSQESAANQALIEEVNSILEKAETTTAKILSEAQVSINTYNQSLEANQQLLSARKQLFLANQSQDQAQILSAQNQLREVFSKNSNLASNTFSQQFFQKTPDYFGKIQGLKTNPQRNSNLPSLFKK